MTIIIIVVLYKCEKIKKMIHTMLKLLGIEERIVFHTLEYHKKIDDIVDQPQKGPLSSIRLPNIVNAIHG